MHANQLTTDQLRAEVTASAGCSMCKSPVEQDPVGEGTDDRAIADTVNTLRDIAINFHAADQLRARIAHVVVPRLKRIQKLEELNDKRLGEIRTTLKLLAEARGERDTLRRNLELVTGALKGLHHVCTLALTGKRGRQHAYFETRAGHFVCAAGVMRSAEEALAAVREPDNHIEHDLEMVPAPACWQPIESAPKDDTPVDIFADGRRLPDMYRVELSADNVFYDSVVSGRCCVRTSTHWMPLPTPPSSPAGEGGDRV